MMVKRLIIMLMLLTFSLNAVTYAKSSYLEAIQNHRNTLNIAEIKKIEEQLTKEVLNDFDKYYSLAIIYNFYTDYYTYIDSDKDQSKKYNNLTIEITLKAIEFNKNNADLFSILADGYSNKITGPTSAFKYGKKVNNALTNAKQINPFDERLHYVLAKRYLLEPTLFGGNIEKAIEELTIITTMNPQSSLYFSWLGIAYTKKKNNDLAKEYYEKALKLSIDNKLAKEQLQQFNK